MTTNKLIELSFFLSTLLSGFYAGTGFFGAMGGNPAIKLMSDKHLQNSGNILTITWQQE